MGKLHRPEPSVNGKWEYAAGPGDFGTKFPNLVEHLSALAWDDGKRRETTTLTFFAEDGHWKACLNDRALGRVAFVTVEDPFALFEIVEGALAGDGMDWRKKR